LSDFEAGWCCAGYALVNGGSHILSLRPLPPEYHVREYVSHCSDQGHWFWIVEGGQQVCVLRV